MQSGSPKKYGNSVADALAAALDAEAGSSPVRVARDILSGHNPASLKKSNKALFDQADKILQKLETSSAGGGRKLIKTGKFGASTIVATVTTGGAVVMEEAYGAKGLYGYSTAAVISGGLLCAFTGPIGCVVGAGLIGGGLWSAVDAGLISGNHKPTTTRNILANAPAVLDALDNVAHKLPDSSTLENAKGFITKNYPDSSTFSTALSYLPDSSKVSDYLPDSSSFSKVSNSTAVGFASNNPGYIGLGIAGIVNALSLVTQAGRTVNGYLFKGLGYVTGGTLVVAAGAAVGTAVIVPAATAFGAAGIYAGAVSMLAIGGTLAWKIKKMPVKLFAGGTITSGTVALADGGYSHYNTGKAELTYTRKALKLVSEKSSYPVLEKLDNYAQEHPYAVAITGGVPAVVAVGPMILPVMKFGIGLPFYLTYKVAMATPLSIIPGIKSIPLISKLPILTAPVVEVSYYMSTAKNLNSTYTASYGKGFGYAVKDIWNHGSVMPSEGITFETANLFANHYLGTKLQTPYLDSVRATYNAKIDTLRENVFSAIDEGRKIDASFCEEVSNAREAAKLDSQLKTPFLGRVAVYARQVSKYDSHTGMSTEAISKACAINANTTLFSALKTDGGDLGLKGSHFYAQQAAISKQTDFAILPNAITEANIECMNVHGATIESCGIHIDNAA